MKKKIVSIFPNKSVTFLWIQFWKIINSTLPKLKIIISKFFRTFLMIKLYGFLLESIINFIMLMKVVKIIFLKWLTNICKIKSN